jgi:hypothetical protein
MYKVVHAIVHAPGFHWIMHCTAGWGVRTATPDRDSFITGDVFVEARIMAQEPEKG